MDGLHVVKANTKRLIIENIGDILLDKFEISRHSLPQNTLFYLYPHTNGDTIRAYYIEKGIAEILETGDCLEVGDVIVCSELKQMSILHFLTDVSLVAFKYNEDSSISFEERVKKMDLIMNKIQEKDHYTKVHCDRVTQLVKLMGLTLGYKSEKFNHLNKAARFHDLGKIFTPDVILNKPSSLTEDEYNVIKKHPLDARILLDQLFDEEIIDIVEKHHECLDGSGYPRGLKAEDIREESRIIAICDAFEAMTSDRVYRKSRTVEYAFSELRKYSGARYDGMLVEQFIKAYCDLDVKI